MAKPYVPAMKASGIHRTCRIEAHFYHARPARTNEIRRECPQTASTWGNLAARAGEVLQVAPAA
jgi:hypothetical protein